MNYPVCNQYLTKYKALLKETGNDILFMDEDSFNCGGFALGLEEWYLPYNDYFDNIIDDIREDYYDTEDDMCDAIADAYIDFMTQEHNWIREIWSESELQDNEYLVGFKASIYDFHYARRLENGQWFHKMGSQSIQEVSESSVYNYDWWYNLPCEYGGKLRLLAVKKLDMAAFRNNRRLRTHTSPHFYYDKLTLNFRKEVA